MRPACGLPERFGGALLVALRTPVLRGGARAARWARSWAAALSALALLAAGPAWAARIGAMDGSFDLGEQALLTPEHGDLSVPEMIDVALCASRAPQADLLLDAPGPERGAPAAVRRARALLPQAARTDLDPPPVSLEGMLRLTDPLGARALHLSAEEEGGRLSQGIGGGLLLRLLGDAEGPLRLALRRMNDPLRAGMGLHASPLAVLAPQESGPSDEDLPPPGGFEVDRDALDRRAMLIGVGLLTLFLALGAVAYSFAPTGGTAPFRR